MMIRTWYRLNGLHITQKDVDWLLEGFVGTCAGFIMVNEFIGCGILDAIRLSGLTESNTEARKLVQGGTIRIKGKQITDPRYKITMDDVVEKPGFHYRVIIWVKKRRVGALIPVYENFIVSPEESAKDICE